MRPTEKQITRWMIVKHFDFDFEKSYFEMTMARINLLTRIADAFGIRCSNGKSKARNLWDEMQKVNKVIKENENNY